MLEELDIPSFCREEEARLVAKYPDKGDKEIADLLAESLEYFVRTGRLMDE